MHARGVLFNIYFVKSLLFKQAISCYFKPQIWIHVT